MNSCESYQELISRLVDGEIDREEQQALMAHMKTCSRCSAMFAVYQDLSDILSEQPEELPAGLHENIMAGVRRSAIIKKNRRTRKFGLRLAMTAAACAVLVLLAASSFGPGGRLADTVSVRGEKAAQQISEDRAQDPVPAAPEAPVPAASEAPVPAAVSVPASAAVPAEIPASVPAEVPAASAAGMPEPGRTPEPIPDAYAAVPDAGQRNDLQSPEVPVQKEYDWSFYPVDPTPSPVEAPIVAESYGEDDTAVANAAPAPAMPEELPGWETVPASGDEQPQPEQGPFLFSDDYGPLFSAQESLFYGEEAPASGEEPVAAVENAASSATGTERAQNADKAVREEHYSIRGIQARLDLLLQLGGNQAQLPDMQPSRVIQITVLPDDEYGSAEKLTIRVYGDFIFYTYYPAFGESSSFRADCSLTKLNACLSSLPAPAESPAPTADSFLEEVPAG